MAPKDRATRGREPVNRTGLRYRERVAWIEGYLDASGTFDTVPARGTPGRSTATSERVGSTLRAYRTIVRDDPDGVRRVTPRPDRIEPVLAALGETLRGRRPVGAPWELFPSRTQAIGAELAAAVGRPVADALGGTFASEGLEHAALTWALDRQDLVGAVARATTIGTVVRLARLAVQGAPKQAHAFLALLAEPGHLDVVCGDDGATPGVALLQLLDAVLGLDEPSRRRAMELAVATYPLSWIAAWRAHHDAVARSRRHEAKSELAVRYGRGPASKNEPHGAAPAKFLGEAWAQVVVDMAASDPAARAVQRVALALPPESSYPGLRARLLVGFGRGVRQDPPPRFVAVLDALAAALPGATAPLALLARWRRSFDVRIATRDPWIAYGWTLPRDLDLRRWFAAIADMKDAIAGRFGDAVLGAFDLLVEHGHPPDQAVVLAERVPEVLVRTSLSWADESAVAIAAGLSRGDPFVFVTALEPLLRGLRRRIGAPEAIVRLVATEDLYDAVLAELADGNAARIERWTTVLGAVGARALPAPEQGPMSVRAPWVREYPEELHASLRRLAAVAEDAPLRAARVLHPVVRTDASLREEIAVLEAKVRSQPSPSLTARLRNLEARRAHGNALRPAAAERARTAIEREIARTRLERVDARLDASMRHVVEKAVGPAATVLLDGPLPVPPSRAASTKLARIVAAIVDLRPAERNLGARLLARRIGPGPFLLHDAPENVRFLETMRSRGRDVDAWLAPNAETVESDGRTFVLALEDDPLEIFLMGEHFETCLSLRGGNFFSAVVNAADANKRVLFARERGNVVGRCLFALTDDGALLTFHAYAHASKVSFERIFATYARSLAARVRAPLAVHGNVRPLVASRWYDDGPTDLTGSAVDVAEGSPLWNELAEIEPAALVRRLREVLGELDARTLGLVLGLPVMNRRPELTVALSGLAFRTPYVPFETRLATAYTCLRGGAAPLAAELLAVPGFWDWVMMRCPCGACEERPNVDPALDLLTTVAPPSALRVIRDARPRRRRRWRDEEPMRTWYAARAYIALGRRRRARDILEERLREPCSHGEDLLRSELAALHDA